MHYIQKGRILCNAKHVRGKWTDIESEVSCDACIDILCNRETNMSLEDHTFGTTQAEVNLARILNEVNNKHLANRVGHLICRFNEIVKCADGMKNKKMMKYFLSLSRDDFWNIVDDLDTDEKVKSHVKNVLTIRYRNLYNKDRGRSSNGIKIREAKETTAQVERSNHLKVNSQSIEDGV